MRILMTFGAVAVAALVACAPQPVDTGQADFDALCAVCHGTSGKGDGPAADALATRPADLTRLAAENGGTFPMVLVMTRIDGYSGDTATMPEFGPLLDGETVLYETEPGVMTPTPTRLLALAEYVETLQE
jgi:mono/diheme cytochrome c family protein